MVREDIAKGIGNKLIKNEAQVIAETLAANGLYSRILNPTIKSIAGMSARLNYYLKINSVDKEHIDSVVKLSNQIARSTGELTKLAKTIKEDLQTEEVSDLDAEDVIYFEDEE